MELYTTIAIKPCVYLELEKMSHSNDDNERGESVSWQFVGCSVEKLKYIQRRAPWPHLRCCQLVLYLLYFYYKHMIFFSASPDDHHEVLILLLPATTTLRSGWCNKKIFLPKFARKLFNLFNHLVIPIIYYCIFVHILLQSLTLWSSHLLNRLCS